MSFQKPPAPSKLIENAKTFFLRSLNAKKSGNTHPHNVILDGLKRHPAFNNTHHSLRDINVLLRKDTYAAGPFVANQ